MPFPPRTVGVRMVVRDLGRSVARGASHGAGKARQAAHGTTTPLPHPIGQAARPVEPVGAPDSLGRACRHAGGVHTVPAGGLEGGGKNLGHLIVANNMGKVSVRSLEDFDMKLGLGRIFFSTE